MPRTDVGLNLRAICVRQRRKRNFNSSQLLMLPMVAGESARSDWTRSVTCPFMTSRASTSLYMRLAAHLKIEPAQPGLTLPELMRRTACVPGLERVRQPPSCVGLEIRMLEGCKLEEIRDSGLDCSWGRELQCVEANRASRKLCLRCEWDITTDMCATLN